jgi:acetyl/propionyl-CoA carboxylase alpha subunit
MYFEAEANGRNYQINVSETRTAWKIDLKEDERDWIHYDIAKTDYEYIEGAISFIFKNSSYLIDVTSRGTEYSVFTRGAHSTIKIYNEEKLLHESLKGGGGLGQSNSLSAGMPGKIVKVMVKPGQEVKEGDPLLIMEAMKMENEMRAAGPAKIKEVLVSQGDTVEAGVTLITFEKIG